jgi:hypothetical protein
MYLFPFALFFLAILKILGLLSDPIFENERFRGWLRRSGSSVAATSFRRDIL